jgi:hypothetical protein
VLKYSLDIKQSAQKELDALDHTPFTRIDLTLSLYQIPPRHPVAEELLNSLRGEGFRDGARSPQHLFS